MKARDQSLCQLSPVQLSWAPVQGPLQSATSSLGRNSRPTHLGPALPAVPSGCCGSSVLLMCLAQVARQQGWNCFALPADEDSSQGLLLQDTSFCRQVGKW